MQDAEGVCTNVNPGAAGHAVRHHLARGGARVRHEVLRRRNARKLAHLSAAKVHLGCGDLPFPGWVNVDLGRSADLAMDLRGGFPAPPGSVELMYSEHFLEHIPLDSAQVLLRDCASSLAPGGVFRAAMPDLRYLVERYLSEQWRDQDWLARPEYAYVDSPARMLNMAMRNWEHLYLYDADELSLRLREAGFTWTRRVERSQSEHPELRHRESRLDSLLVMEAGTS